MPQPASAFVDTPLTTDQVKAAGYTDAPLTEDHPWTARFPKTAAVARGVVDALPGIGGIVGGAIATPETAGLATVPGVALGVGAGRGLRDLIAEGLGLDRKSSAGEKAGRIALDVGEAATAQALLPGLFEALKTPGRTVRQVLDLLPAKFRPAIPEGLAKAPAEILRRPAWQTWEEYLPKPTARPTPGRTSTAWAPGAAPEAPMAPSAPMAEGPLGSASGGTPPPSGPPPGAPPASASSSLSAQAPSARPKLSAEDLVAYRSEFDRLRAEGKTEAQALRAIEVMHELKVRYGLKIPTKAATKFPKGWSGNKPPSE